MQGDFNKLFFFQKFVDKTKCQCFAFTPQANFPAHNLNFHERWIDLIQTTFLNLFYFTTARPASDQITIPFNKLPCHNSKFDGFLGIITKNQWNMYGSLRRTPEKATACSSYQWPRTLDLRNFSIFWQGTIQILRKSTCIAQNLIWLPNLS